MSISDRLAAAPQKNSNRGCRTCKWVETISDKDRASIQNWVENGWSMRQLHNICATDPENPLTVCLTAFRNHLQDCR